MRSIFARLAIVSLALAFVACGRGAGGAAPPGAVAPSAVTPGAPNAVALPPSSPPRPAPTDWKGLFDSDSQLHTVPPAPDSVVGVLQHQPSCSRALATVTSGAFTSENRLDTAYLLSCGATERVVVATETAFVATLDVSGDALFDAGDLDWDGRSELLLLSHAGPNTTVRVLRLDGTRLASIYAFTATPDPCTHVIIYYRFAKPNLEYRVDTLPKRCTP